MKRLLLANFVLVSLFTMNASANDEPHPMIKDWTGEYGGVPPFNQVEISQFKPILERAMENTLSDIQKIGDQKEPATFENTIVTMERAGKALANVQTLYGVWSNNMSTPEFQEVEKEMEPKLAAFQDKIYQNPGLFKRIDAVYKSGDQSNLNPEQKRLVWYYHTQFVLHGAQLNSSGKTRVAKINQRLAALYTQFSQNQLSDEEKDGLIIDKKEDLEGLPKSMVDSALDEAARQKLEGKWVITNTRSSMEPFLTYSSSRPMREKAFKKWMSRGDNSNATDNNRIVSEIIQLRTERSKVYGYDTFADWHFADTMAKKPVDAMDLMIKVWKPAVEQVRSDVAEMQTVVDSEKGGFKIEPWDYRYYAEKVRKKKYDLDIDTVKPYLQLEKIRKAMFWVANQLYGFTFTKIEGIPVFHDDVTVYKVTGAQNQLIGLWYFDPYARPGKRSGAWMSAYRDQNRMDGKDIKTLVSNNSNFIEGKPGEPVLISWDDATTMFHEFGHALHGLNSNVTYPMLAGTNTARDFVEFPSQFAENYLQTPEVLKFLTNSKGEPLPKQLVDKINRAKNFNQAFRTVEYLASAIVDLKLHQIKEGKVNPRIFESKVLSEIGMPSEIVMRHRIPHFSHLFSGEGYAAGYYGYLWADVLSADAFEAFEEAKNPYDKRLAKQFRERIMSVGNTVDPMDAFKSFRGRGPEVDALLRSRGFLSASQK